MTEKKRPERNPHFKFLGNCNSTCFYLPRGAEQVVAIKSGSHHQAQLEWLAPADWWLENFMGGSPKRPQVDWDAAREYCFVNSKKAGVFEEGRNQRGIGVWREGERIIVHTGEYLMIDGERVELFDHESRIMYKRSPESGYAIVDERATNDQAKELFNLIAECSWERKAHAALLAGFLVISPFSGLIKYRPHIWMNAYMNAGKSSIMDKIVTPLLDGIAIKSFGQDTWASIPNAIGITSRPVIMDEMDAETRSEKEQMEQILKLVRLASTGGTRKKVSMLTGENIESHVRTSFMFTSINNQLEHMADVSRFSVIELLRDRRPKEEVFRWYSSWKNRVEILFENEFGKRFFSRNLARIEDILESAIVFEKVGVERLSLLRTGEQVGILMAGAYSMLHDGVPDEHQAREFLDKFATTESSNIHVVEDHDRCLDLILSSKIKVNGDKGAIDVQIRDAVAVCLGFKDDAVFGASYAAAALESYDIKVVKNKGIVLIRKPSTHIEKLLKDSPFQREWPKLIGRCEDVAITTSPTRGADGKNAIHVMLHERIFQGEDFLI